MRTPYAAAKSPAGQSAGRGLRFLAACLIALGACSSGADAALIAGPTITITGDANTTGVFELTVQNTGPDVILLEGFELGVSVSPSTGVLFTSAGTDTQNLPYVFEGISLVEQGLGDFTLDTLPAASFIASDLVFFPPLISRTILPGEVFGLARIGYSIGGTATTGVPVSITFTPSFTTAPIPEPAAIVQAAIGSAFAVGGLRRTLRRRRAS